MSHKERSSVENLGLSIGAKAQPERERRQRRVHWWGEAPEQPDCFRGAKDLLRRKIVTYANTRAEPDSALTKFDNLVPIFSRWHTLGRGPASV